MALAVLREKGQVSVEFILVIVIALMYIQLAVWPAVNVSTETAKDVKAVADAKLTSMKIANALNEAAVSNGDMRKTISVFVPSNSEIRCNPAANAVEYDVVVGYVNDFSSPDPIKCADKALDAGGNAVGWICRSSVPLLEAVSPLFPAGACPVMSTGDADTLFGSLVVEKMGGTIGARWPA